MTKDDVIRLAKQAELIPNSPYLMPHDHKMRGLKAFAKLVAEHEREACAKVLDDMANDMEREMEPSTAIAYVRSKAAAIRARGEA